MRYVWNFLSKLWRGISIPFIYIWKLIKGIYFFFSVRISKNETLIWRLLGISLIIFGAWYGFLFLVKDPPLDPTPSLIMVWVSAILLVLGLFPQIFDRIKKIKFKDFEIELQDTIKAVSEDPSIAPFLIGEELIIDRKGNWENLVRILHRASTSPNTPMT